MTIRYAETYQVVTPESAAYGEAEEQGFIDECLESDFRGMVSMLEGTEPSCSPLTAAERNVWFTYYGYDYDFTSAAEESRNYHPASDRDARYMVKAWMVANS